VRAGRTHWLATDDECFGRRMILTRFPADLLTPGCGPVQRNLSGYDARYIALAEAVATSALLTTDRITRSQGQVGSNSGTSQTGC